MDKSTRNGLFRVSPNAAFLAILDDLHSIHLTEPVTRNRKSYPYIITERVRNGTRANQLRTIYEESRERYVENPADADALQRAILIHIVSESILMGYWLQKKLLLVHAGIDFTTPLRQQKLSVVCNIRDRVDEVVEGADMLERLWMMVDERVITKHVPRDTCIVFGHYSALRRANFDRPVLLDRSLSKFVCLDTGCYDTGVVSCMEVGTRTNRYATNKLESDRTEYGSTFIYTVRFV